MVHTHKRSRKNLVDGTKLEMEKISETESERVQGDDENLSYGNDQTFPDDFNGELIFGDDTSASDDENDCLKIGEVDDIGWRSKSS